MKKKKHPFLVAVPKTDRGAYNHGRFISSLIEQQLKHLHEVEKTLPSKDQTNTDLAAIKTELDASEYIRRVTAKLHPHGAHTATADKPATKRKKRIAAIKRKKSKPSKRKRK